MNPVKENKALARGEVRNRFLPEQIRRTAIERENLGNHSARKNKAANVQTENAEVGGVPGAGSAGTIKQFQEGKRGGNHRRDDWPWLRSQAVIHVQG